MPPARRGRARRRTGTRTWSSGTRPASTAWRSPSAAAPGTRCAATSARTRSFCPGGRIQIYSSPEDLENYLTEADPEHALAALAVWPDIRKAVTDGEAAVLAGPENTYIIDGLDREPAGGAGGGRPQAAGPGRRTAARCGLQRGDSETTDALGTASPLGNLVGAIIRPDPERLAPGAAVSTTRWPPGRCWSTGSPGPWIGTANAADNALRARRDRLDRDRQNILAASRAAACACWRPISASAVARFGRNATSVMSSIAGPVQPVPQVRRLEVGPERRRPAGPVDGAGVDDGGLPTGQQPGVAGSGSKPKTIPGWLTTSMNCLRM